MVNLKELINSDKILKAVIVCDTEDQQKISKLLEQMPELNIGFAPGMADPDITFANITSAKASREAAFKAVIDYLKIKAENTLAFGDADSDIPFLTC